MADFTRLIENIPDFKEFLTVDEMDENSKKLAAEYPDKVSVFQAGTSRKGHPIYCLKIGSGSRNAFMFGCPHPNEPMGAMMLEYFSRAIAEDDKLREELDYTWYLIKSIGIVGERKGCLKPIFIELRTIDINKFDKIPGILSKVLM